MEFEKVLSERYSVRSFSEKKVEREKVDKILHAAALAPTAKNNQPQKIFVIESREGLEKVKKCTVCHFDAPLVFLICFDSSVSWKSHFDGRDFGPIDASIVTTQMMLEATNIGLGTTWVGLFDPETTRQVFELPENIVPVHFCLPGILPKGVFLTKDTSCVRKLRKFLKIFKKLPKKGGFLFAKILFCIYNV